MRRTIPIIYKTATNLVLAGDIGQLGHPLYKPFFDSCSARYKNVFTILGNHEYYHPTQEPSRLLKEYTSFFKQYKNVHLLNDSSHQLGDYTLYGTTLWANISDTKGLSDFYSIPNMNRTLFLNMHLESLSKLAKFLKTSSGKQIIITHFSPLPHHLCSHPKYSTQSDHIKQYFSNNILDNLDTQNVHLWVSGHTHYSYKLMHKNILFVSNQMGYPYENIIYSKLQHVLLKN